MFGDIHIEVSWWLGALHEDEVGVSLCKVLFVDNR